MAAKEISLDNKTIVKLVMAMVKANELVAELDNVPGPMVRKLLAALDQVDRMKHFQAYEPSVE